MGVLINQSSLGKPRTILMLLLVIVAGVEFMVRGPLRRDSAPDLAAPYVSSLRFLRLENPYSSKDFISTFRTAGALPGYWVDDFGQHSIYPPMSLVAFSPFALLSLHHAHAVYRWLCTICYVGLVLLLAGEVGNAWVSSERLGFVAFALAISSAQTGIYLGNVSMLSFLLCGFALLLAYRGRENWAGILLSIGFCLKPTTAIALTLLVLLYRRKAAYAFIASGTLLVGASLAVMSRIDRVWMLDYAANMHFMFSPGGAASFTTENTSRFDLLNLQVPIYEIFRNALIANVVSWTIFAFLAGIWVSVFIRTSRPDGEYNWLSISSLCLIALLPAYQRNYNIVVVVFALLWAFKHLYLRAARVVLILGAVFLVPGEAILRKINLPVAFTQSSLWNAFVMPNATWAVLALACLLLYVQISGLESAVLGEEPSIGNER